MEQLTYDEVAPAGERIGRIVATWRGVTVHDDVFSGREFRLGSRELGHIHDDSVVDIPLQKNLRDRLVSRRQAEPHPDLPHTGWVSFYLRDDRDIAHAIRLFKLAYLSAVKRAKRAPLIMA